MPKYLIHRRRRWYFVIEIPKDVNHAFGGKRRHVQSLKTESLTVAERLARPLAVVWKESFEKVRSGSLSPLVDLEQKAHEWHEDFKRASSDEERDIYKDVLQEEVEKLSRTNKDQAETFVAIVREGAFRTSTYVEEWLTLSDNQPKTNDGKRSDIHRLAEVLPYSNKINKKAVQSWADNLQHIEGLSPVTVRRVMSSCRGYWSFLERSGRIQSDTNPFDGAVERTNRKTKAARKDDRQPFTGEEAVALYNAAIEKGDTALADLIWLGMWTGCRIEELCSLRVDNVSVNSFEVTDAKTGAGLREIPIHSRLRERLTRLTSVSADGYVISGLSPNKYGDRSNAVGKRFGRLKTRFGFSKPHVFHSLRKTVSTKLENAGVAESIAADILGHEKQTMTYGLYSGGTSFENMQRAIEKLSYPI